MRDGILNLRFTIFVSSRLRKFPKSQIGNPKSQILPVPFPGRRNPDAETFSPFVSEGCKPNMLSIRILRSAICLGTLAAKWVLKTDDFNHNIAGAEPP